MMMMGSEVKSMRDNKLSLDEAYIRVKGQELWLIGADIAHYKMLACGIMTRDDLASSWSMPENSKNSLAEHMNGA